MSKEQEKKEGKTVREIIEQARTGVPSGSDVMAKHHKMMAQQLEESYIERMLEEEKIKLQRLRETQGTPIQAGQAQNFLQTLFLGRKPDEIKAILDMLEPEHIDKIIAMNNNTFADFKNVARSSGTDAKTIIEAVKTGVDVAKAQTAQTSNMGDIIKSMTDMFKTGVEVGRSERGSQQQPNTFDTLKQYHEMFLKPVLDQLAGKDKDIMEMRMKEIESRIVNPMDYIKHIKEAAKDLGLSTGQKTELDLKLAEMAQTERIEDKKLNWEMTKYQEEKESNKEIYGIIREAIKGPVSDLTKNLGGAAADRLRAGGGQPAPKIQTITCPGCNKPFPAIAGAPQVVCPSCGAVLGLTQQPPPQPPVPPQTQEPPPPTEAPPTVTEQPPESTPK